MLKTNKPGTSPGPRRPLQAAVRPFSAHTAGLTSFQRAVALWPCSSLYFHSPNGRAERKCVPSLPLCCSSSHSRALVGRPFSSPGQQSIGGYSSGGYVFSPWEVGRVRSALRLLPLEPPSRAPRISVAHSHCVPRVT